MLRTGLVLLVLVFPAAAQGTLRVPSQYRTIQEAINAAGANDTVLVAPGTYAGPIDFLGKNLHLRSEAGAAVTTIAGSYGPSAAVNFKRGEGPTAILEGFTVDCKSRCRGVRCDRASPTLLDCRIVNGTAPASYGGFPWASVGSVGGGLFFTQSRAEVAGCTIAGNIASATAVNYADSAYGYGGGLAAVSSTLSISRCTIAFNRARASAPLRGETVLGGGVYEVGGSSTVVNSILVANEIRPSRAGSKAFGGGAYAGPLDLFINCIVGGNRSVVSPYSSGSGVYGGEYVNCIIRQNTPYPQIAFAAVTYCSIEEGYPGLGNFGGDPQFLDGSYHLAWSSPCRDRGSSAVPGLPATDFEGDPRLAGTAVDVGYDEFYAHLFVTGAATPGGRITIRVIGRPGADVFWALGTRILAAPLTVPGLAGKLWIDPTWIAILPLGKMPAASELRFTYDFPPGFPRISIPVQALAGKELSNLVVVHVR